MTRVPPFVRRRPAGIVAATGFVLAVAGCSTHELESGYAYRPLNSSTVERRAFYADPYSLDARRAESEKAADKTGPVGGRRPGPGGPGVR